MIAASPLRDWLRTNPPESTVAISVSLLSYWARRVMSSWEPSE